MTTKGTPSGSRSTAIRWPSGRSWAGTSTLAPNSVARCTCADAGLCFTCCYDCAATPRSQSNPIAITA